MAITIFWEEVIPLTIFWVVWNERNMRTFDWLMMLMVLIYLKIEGFRPSLFL